MLRPKIWACIVNHVHDQGAVACHRSPQTPHDFPTTEIIEFAHGSHEEGREKPFAQSDYVNQRWEVGHARTRRRTNQFFVMAPLDGGHGR